jgi:NAD(P)-dependent dehydrogenase (short-subunit alcohol dehydrogenase family)
VGSWADVAPIESSAAYSASKGALHALTRAIAADIGPLGLDIEVHEWIPGHLNTRMSEFTGMDPAVSAAWGLALAREVRADHRSRIYENDREWLPPKPLKQRLKERVLFWR